MALVGSSGNVRTGQIPSDANIGDNVVVMNLIGTGNHDTAEHNIAAIEIRFVVLVRLGPSGTGADSVFSIMDRMQELLHRYEPSFTGATASTHRMTSIRSNDDYQPIDVPNPDQYVAYELSFGLYNQTL